MIQWRECAQHSGCPLIRAVTVSTGIVRKHSWRKKKDQGAPPSQKVSAASVNEDIYIQISTCQMKENFPGTFCHLSMPTNSTPIHAHIHMLAHNSPHLALSIQVFSSIMIAIKLLGTIFNSRHRLHKMETVHYPINIKYYPNIKHIPNMQQ